MRGRGSKKKDLQHWRFHEIQSDIEALQKLLSAGAFYDQLEPLVRRIKAAYTELYAADPKVRLALLISYKRQLRRLTRGQEQS